MILIIIKDIKDMINETIRTNHTFNVLVKTKIAHNMKIAKKNPNIK